MARKAWFRSVTPKGVAFFPKLDEPDTRFDTDGVYKIGLLLDEQEGEKFLAFLNEKRDEAVEFIKDTREDIKPAKLKKMGAADVSCKMEEDDEGEETGNYIFNFKMKAKVTSKKTGKTYEFRPGVFDAKGNAIDPTETPIWGGSVVKIAYELSPYYTPKDNEAGVSLRLEAVQVIERQGPGERSASSYGFGEEDGFDASKEAGAFDEAPADGDDDDGAGDF
ncbi:MAG: hypothetical protein KKE29_20080 [Proteobacteria bacterium]|nr:hypothetical protein [Pseudomonadota bacterium]MBU4576022.1 hypothetical protein [Pseudomonadota bacterium]MBV1715988.1 hypothetical protein [Desulfarculus sp.]